MLTRLAIVTAPALVLLWSTGFIGARYGMPYIEPLTLLAVRMGFAVVIIAAIALLAGARRPNATALFAYILFGERLDSISILGMLICASGVALVNRGIVGLPKRRHFASACLRQCKRASTR